MRHSRFFWLFVIIALVSAVSLYFSSRKLNELRSGPVEKTIVIDAPTPGPTPAAATAVSSGSIPEPIEERLKTSGPEEKAGCVLQPEFKKLKNDLGLLVNKQEGDISQFLEKINEFRKENGLPIPMLISADKLEKQNIVYNNCRSSCGGSVQEVFVSQILNHNFIQALSKDGKFQNLSLGRGGIDLATVDELNARGLPFRSWPMPASDSDWYIQGTDLYYRLDIQGLWLKVGANSTWEVTAQPKESTRLDVVQDSLSVKGCSLDEKCFQAGLRHFKAPELCVKSE